MIVTGLGCLRVDNARKLAIKHENERLRNELELELYAHDITPKYKGYNYFSDGRAWGVTNYCCVNYETEQMEFYAPDGSMRETVNLPKGMKKILTDDGWLYSFNGNGRKITLSYHVYLSAIPKPIIVMSFIRQILTLSTRLKYNYSWKRSGQKSVPIIKVIGSTDATENKARKTTTHSFIEWVFYWLIIKSLMGF